MYNLNILYNDRNRFIILRGEVNNLINELDKSSYVLNVAISNAIKSCVLPDDVDRVEDLKLCDRDICFRIDKLSRSVLSSIENKINGINNEIARLEREEKERKEREAREKALKEAEEAERLLKEKNETSRI